MVDSFATGAYGMEHVVSTVRGVLARVSAGIISGDKFFLVERDSDHVPQGLGVIAVDAAKLGADVFEISGHAGGTGAASRVDFRPVTTPNDLDFGKLRVEVQRALDASSKREPEEGGREDDCA